MNNNSGPLTLALAGAGRTGQTLGLLLQLLGYRLTTVLSRQPSKLQLGRLWTVDPNNRSEVTNLAFDHTISVAEVIDALGFANPTAEEVNFNAPQIITYEEYFPQPDLLIIATPDDAIEATAHQIAATVKDQWLCASQSTNFIAWHCSGARSSLAITELKALGAQIGSVHPLKSIAHCETDWATLQANFQGVFWGLEGDPAAVSLGQQLVTATQGRAITLTAAQKPLYHAAAVLACGHLVALVEMSQRLLQECGLDRPTAQEMLLPLVKGTVENLAHGTTTALTGPFARRDWQTINLHLQALMSLNQDYVTIYSLLGKQAWNLKSSEKSEALPRVTLGLNSEPT